MSSRTSRFLLAGLVGVTVACFLSAPVRAQDKPDILEDQKNRLQIAVQQAEVEVRQAKKDARVLARKDAKQALLTLTALRDQIGTNPDLPDEKRKALVHSLNISIDALAARSAEATAPLPTPPFRTGDKKPVDDGHGVYDLAKNEQTRAKNAKLSDAEMKALRENNFLRVQEDVDKTSIPQVEDIKFPADWAAKTAKRQASNLTKEERKIIEALNKPLDVELKDSTLEDVIGYLKDQSGVTIIVPQSILEEKMITYKVPVSVNLKKVTLRTILKKVLADVGLVYIVKDNVIQVTTEERAKQTLTTRTYYMGDLLLLTDLRIPQFAQQAQALRTINDVIGVIVGTVEPDSWWVNGGPGRIVFDPRTMSLVVTQTAEVHYMMNLKGR